MSNLALKRNVGDLVLWHGIAVTYLAITLPRL